MKFCFTWALLSFALVGCDRLPTTPPADSTPKTAPSTNIVATPTPTLPLTPTPSSPADDRLNHALALKKEGKLAEARALLQEVVSGSNVTEQAQLALGDIDTEILFSPAPAPEKVDYTIESGDSLGKLASKYGTTIDLIKRANNISGDKIRIGDRLRIYQGKFAVEVSKTANLLTVTDNEHFFKRYRVGTGQFSKTPVGDFKIMSRLQKPPWYRSDGTVIRFGDPENILGTHWLGLDIPHYGIHGTWETNSIGKQSSAGCVRLLNDDVAELYTMLPVGTPVTIHD